MNNLLSWWNLAFLIPGATGLILGLLSTFGLGEADADNDLELDIDVDVDVDADVDAEVDADADGDADGESDDHASATASHDGPGLFARSLALLGVGRVPIAVALTALMLSFAIAGLFLNQGLGSFLKPAVFFPISLSIAGVGSVVATAAFSRVLGRALPKRESYADSFAGLAGRTGTVVLLRSETEGFAQIRDRYGNMREVRVQAAPDTTLTTGMPVQVVKARTDLRLCVVVEDEVARLSSAATKQRQAS